MKLLLALLLAQVSVGEGLPDAGTFTRPIEVFADRLQVQGKHRQATWTGHVRATRGRTLLRCDRMIAHYRNGEEIARLECLGNVEVEDGNKWAKGERADFDNDTGILVVTGKPEAREGRNYMRGERIVFDVNKDTVEVDRPSSIFETKGGPPQLPRTAPDAGLRK